MKVKNQTKFLVTHLRGTSRTLTESDAKAQFGIANLRARVFDMRKLGLRVRVTAGEYKVSARDTKGSRSKVFA